MARAQLQGLGAPVSIGGAGTFDGPPIPHRRAETLPNIVVCLPSNSTAAIRRPASPDDREVSRGRRRARLEGRRRCREPLLQGEEPDEGGNILEGLVEQYTPSP
jgi:hypothetical protein